MPTILDALQHLGIDYADEVVTANVQRAMNTAIRIAKGAIGQDIEQYFGNDARLDELILAYTDDLYSERGVSAKVSNATRSLMQTIELQLRVELQGIKEAAAE